MDKIMNGLIVVRKNKSNYQLDRQPRSYGWNTGNCMFCGRPATQALGREMMLICAGHKAK